MSYGVHSDEVAEDYRKALEDLNMNSRYEISNLTVIAKENNEHALAISEALKDHIKRTAPPKKLPAFYVLDSIVKNVGTPYTLFFGRNLYSTFMEAYALVDGNVRRKMEEMVQTWKQPVPGSLDSRPVFPVDVTKPIENALLKFRTSTMQAHQEFARNQQQIFARRAGSAPYRNTPTPPNATRAQFPLPGQAQPYMQYQNGNGQTYPTQQYPQNYGNYPPSATGTPTSWQRDQGLPKPEASLDVLNSDIANLIADSKAAFAQNPTDVETQTRLKALIDLQEILARQNLPPDQIGLIRQRVSEMQAARVSPAAPPAPVPSALPIHNPPEVTPTPPNAQPTLSSLLGPNALAALLAKAAAAQQNPIPSPQPVPAAIRSPQPRYASIEPASFPPAPPAAVPAAPAAAAPAGSASGPNSLIEQLRAAGLLPSTQARATNGAASLLPTLPQPPMPGNLGATRSPLGEIPNDVQLNAQSLKIPRPHLISSLYEKLGAPCTQCGRRFKTDEEGRLKKTAHMDWHFRVHQRMGDAEKRGQHRSWYVDELDWIKSREVDEGELPQASNDASPKSAAPQPKQQYVAVPDDPALAQSMCPICQEKFEMKWLDDAQEFVWMDAVKIGGRIYHASCHAEATKDGGNTPSYQRGTPEPVLGKRKAEVGRSPPDVALTDQDDHVFARSKLKSEHLP